MPCFLLRSICTPFAVLDSDFSVAFCGYFPVNLGTMEPGLTPGTEDLTEHHAARGADEFSDPLTNVLHGPHDDFDVDPRGVDLQNFDFDTTEFFGDDTGFSNVGATDSHVFGPLGPPPCPPGDMDASMAPTALSMPEPGFAAGSIPSGMKTSVAPVGPVVSKSVQDATFSRALLTNCRVTEILLPWESGFYKEFFSDEPFEQLVPKMPVSDFCDFGVAPEPQHVAQTLAGVASDSNPNPIFSRFVECKDDGSYAAKQASLRNVALNKFLVVLKHDLSGSVTGRHILELGSEDQRALGAHTVIEAVLGIRSPATLVKRANSLLSYLRWFSKLGSGFGNPFTEAFIWDYLQHLKDVGAPATKGDSAMSAFRFAFHILGIESLGQALNSRRLIGTCEIMLAGKRLLKQAMVLTVAQVKGLHAALINKGLHEMDRAIVAYILFALYGRCRNSDLLMIHSIEKDYNDSGGFVIIQTSHHKTGRLAALKTRLMPIVVPARGIDGSIWVEEALKVLEMVGACMEMPIDGPLLKAPTGESKSFMMRGLRTTEVSSMLRRFVGAPDPVPGCQEPVVSSHSLKATTLSWCARFGISPATRSMLGRHTSCLNETFAIYPRDLVCAPVAELQVVIDSIHEGNFTPDSQRSEFFKRATDDVATPVEPGFSDKNARNAVDGSTGEVESAYSELHECAGGEAGPTGLPHADNHAGDHAEVGEDGTEKASASASDSSSDSSVGSSSSDSEDLEPTPRVKRFRAKIPEEQAWFVHSKSTLVHRFDGDTHNDVKYLVCGKRLTSAYVACTEATAWNVLCKTCNRR